MSIRGRVRRLEKANGSDLPKVIVAMSTRDGKIDCGGRIFQDSDEFYSYLDSLPPEKQKHGKVFLDIFGIGFIRKKEEVQRE